ncbi:MAG TPA: T9SS type A sorting domain-containing protein, partial [Chitinophagaceae bacterium]|nr:T9SS type A sorting domain-containing protein [Chitinophagaceae bacterium]
NVGSLTMIMKMKDKGEPGANNDTYSIEVRNSTGTLIYSSNFASNLTSELPISGGNIQVNGSVVTTNTLTNSLTNGPAILMDARIPEISAKIYPNPSTNVFNLTFTGGTKEKLDVTIMDVSGRTVKVYKVDPIGTFRFGDGLRPGIYMIQVKQGTSNRVFKVIKQ